MNLASASSIIHLVQLNNIQGFNIDRYDFTSSPTDDIPFPFIILESNSLRTKYLLDHTNKIVTEDTANLENKDVIASSSSFDCNNYSINLQTFNMKFKVITEVTLYLDLRSFSLAAVTYSETTMIII